MGGGEHSSSDQLSEVRLKIVDYCSFGAALLSCICCLIIVVYYIAKKRRRPFEILLLNLNIAYVLLTLCRMISLIDYQILRKDNLDLCNVIGPVNAYSFVVTLCWTFCIATDLLWCSRYAIRQTSFETKIDMNMPRPRWVWAIYYFLSWGVPILFVAYPASRTRFNTDQAKTCWFTSGSDLEKETGFFVILAFLVFDFIYCIISYLIIAFVFGKKMHYSGFVSGSSKSQFFLFKVIKMYILIFLICGWGFIPIDFMDLKKVQGTVYFIFLLIAEILTPLLGFLNFLNIFFNTKFKENCLRCICGGIITHIPRQHSERELFIATTTDTDRNPTPEMTNKTANI